MKVPTFTTIRTWVLLIVGVGGIIWETVAESTDRPALLVVFLMLCGFPVVLNLDSLLRKAPSTPPPGLIPQAEAPQDPVKEPAP